ncbi:MAG: 6-phosphofructokinase [Clostridia bacterium]|nr:6-phosphofructokinase [Clostridia bacterium]
MSIKTIGVLTSGGDAPGMNAAVRAVVRSALGKGYRVIGIKQGYRGLLNGDMIEMDARCVSEYLQRGGTMLETARCLEFKTPEGIEKGAQMCKDKGIDALVVIGGDGSFKGARALSEHGILTIAIPGTIDNDITCSEYTIGFDTALNTAVEAVDKVRDTCTSHHRCSVIEVMGKYAGYIAVETAIASGAEIVLTPEVPFDFQEDVIEVIKQGRANGRRHNIIIVAEGIAMDTNEIAKRIQEETGIDTRATILGHIQRGGCPTVRDRVVAAQMGDKAVELISNGKTNRVVVMRSGEICDLDITEGLEMQKSLSRDMYRLVRKLSVSK